MPDGASPARQPKIEQVEVAERADARGVWTVEAIDDDGAIYQAIFAGPDAELRAHEYGHFKYR